MDRSNHHRMRNRSILIKFKDLAVIKEILEDVDLSEREQRTKERVDSLIKKIEEPFVKVVQERGR